MLNLIATKQELHTFMVPTSLGGMLIINTTKSKLSDYIGGFVWEAFWEAYGAILCQVLYTYRAIPNNFINYTDNQKPNRFLIFFSEYRSNYLVTALNEKSERLSVGTRKKKR